MNLAESADRVEKGPPRNKQEAAYDLIRARIESGQYAPGHRLIIDQLAADLGISQVPIREAIRRLEAEFLIIYAANTGPAVAPFNPERWAQLFESVAVLEGYATALAAPFIVAADLLRLKQCNQAIRRALPALNLTEISRSNRQFHAIMLSRCPNKVVLEQLAQSQVRLDSLSRVMFARDHAVLMELLGPKAGLLTVVNHDKLIAAVRAKRSPAVIEQITRDHVLVHLRAACDLLDRRSER
jgi:DNA-binding GntR family transcriptional regulator